MGSVDAALLEGLGPDAGPALLAWIDAAGDPEAVRRGVERLLPVVRRVGAAARLPALAELAAASDFLPRVLAARPGLLAREGGTGEKAAEAYRAEARAHLRRARGREALLRQIRRYKYRELSRISWKDVVEQAPTAELGRELAHLAEALVAGTLEALAPNALPFCVLALGKLGGQDLNFSSDVDLVYVYRGEATEDARPFFRLAEALTQSLSAQTQDGFAYRVDLNLRPQGRAGPIVLSLAAALQYYETFGRTWERAALIKARPVAGDLALGHELLAALEPFLWRRSADASVVEELREMRAQIGLRGQASARDVKLGPGGIREVEFFVSALQLLHGGRNAQLRSGSTLQALRRLSQAGIVSVVDADRLEEAYLFLRRLENRLQMREERQTQTTPEGAPERARLARSLGFPDARAFEDELSAHRRVVSAAFDELLGRIARDETPDEPLIALALDLDAPREERIRALAERGFDEAKGALATIDRLARGPSSPFSRGAAGPGLQALRWLSDIARTPDPDQALAHFAELLGTRAVPARLGFLERFPLAARRLMSLFGQSGYLSRYLLAHPELVDALAQGDASASKPPEVLQQELSSRVHRTDDVEERLSTLRRYKNEELLRIGLADISGELGVPEVAAQLTAIADASLDETLWLAVAEQRERYGDCPSSGGRPPLAVMGLGKLGGRELGYHSDLDLLFVYDGKGDDETSGGSRGRVGLHEYFAKVVQRLCALLEMRLREGTLYRVDARLRPSGNQGPLVVSKDAFREHHRTRAQLWERQALIKARGCAGDGALFAWIQREVIDALVYERPLPEGAPQEIDRLRRRMETERGREDAEELDAKLGRGGLVDVEFATQYLQLVHGAALPAVRTPNTLEAISALVGAGCLDAPTAQTLRDGYVFHRRVENRLRLVHGFSLSRLPASGKPLELLARRLGYRGRSAGQDFLEEYRTYTSRVRDVYARALRRL